MIPQAFEFLAEVERYNRSKEIEYLQLLSKAQARQPSPTDQLMKVVEHLGRMLKDAGQWLEQWNVSPERQSHGQAQ